MTNLQTKHTPLKFFLDANTKKEAICLQNLFSDIFINEMLKSRKFPSSSHPSPSLTRMENSSVKLLLEFRYLHL